MTIAPPLPHAERTWTLSAPPAKEARFPLGPAASAGAPSNQGARRRHARRMGEVEAGRWVEEEGRGARPLVPRVELDADTEFVFGSGAGRISCIVFSDGNLQDTG